MEDHNGLDHLGMHFEDQNAALSAILNNGVEDVEAAFSTLSPAELKQLEMSVKKLKMQAKVPGGNINSSGMPGSHKSSKLAHHPPALSFIGAPDGQHLMQPYGANFSHQGMNGHDDHGLLLHGHHHQLLDMGHLQDPSLQSPLGGPLIMPAMPMRSHSHHHSTNLPASCPILEIRDGLEYLMFTYSTKGQQQEYAIKTEIESINIEEIPDDFKAENCVYPRAFCPRDQYVGNRWEYETACNDLAWKLTWLNSDVLAGKRGLIQRAVDSYRNRLTEMRSRRVIRQEKLSNGTLRRRTTETGEIEGTYHSRSGSGLPALPISPHMAVPMMDASGAGGYPTTKGSKKSRNSKVSLDIAIENINEADVDEEFKIKNFVYPENWGPEVGASRREYERECNEIAWKLAYLNKEQLLDKKGRLHKAVEFYRARMEQDRAGIPPAPIQSSGGGRMRKSKSAPGSLTSLGGASESGSGLSFMDSSLQDSGMFDNQKQEEFSAIVANTLQQALSHHDLAGHDLSSVVNDLELNGHGDGTGVYDSFHQHIYDSSNGGFYH